MAEYRIVVDGCDAGTIALGDRRGQVTLEGRVWTVTLPRRIRFLVRCKEHASDHTTSFRNFGIGTQSALLRLDPGREVYVFGPAADRTWTVRDLASAERLLTARLDDDVVAFAVLHDEVPFDRLAPCAAAVLIASAARLARYRAAID